jgi:hypothetical protein
VSLIDYNLVRAFQEAQAPRQRAIENLTQTIGDSVGDVGAGLAKRGMDVKSKRAEIEAYEKALNRERGLLESERASLMRMEPMGQFEKAQRDTDVDNIERRLAQIGQVENQLPDIGDVNFRNVYRTSMPEVGGARTRQPGARFKDIELGVQAERQRKQDAAAAAKEAKDDQRYERDFQLKEKQVIRQQQADDLRLRAQDRADRKEEEDRRRQELKEEKAAEEKRIQNLGNVNVVGYLVDDVDRAIDLLQYSPSTAGGFGKVQRAVVPWYQNKAKVLAGHVESIKDTLSGSKLVELKMSNVGLGAVPASQWEALSRLAGNLDVNQDPDVLLENLRRVRETYAEILATAEKALGVSPGESLGKLRESRGQGTPKPTLQELMRMGGQVVEE